MPYNLNEAMLNMSSFYTKDLDNYETMWSLDFGMQSETFEPNFITKTVKIKLTRKYKNYLLTFPTYVVYILCLLMFLLPQNSNQRIIIGINKFML